MNNVPLAGIRQVHFMPRFRAEGLRPPAGAVVISVHDSSEPPAHLHDGWADRLTLCFHDNTDIEGVSAVFSREQARQAIHFVHKHKNSAPALYVHCSMGISRSAGIALAFATMLQVPCYREGQLQTPESWPRKNQRCLDLLQVEAFRMELRAAFGFF